MKIGDQVKYIGSPSNQVPKGAEGIIVDKENSWWVVDYEGDKRVSRNPLRGNRRIWGQGEKSLELVEEPIYLTLMRPTWEMLKESKPGDRWVSEQYKELVLEHHSREGLRLKKLCDEEVFQEGMVYIDSWFLNTLWSREPKIVDFPEAWAAFEEGKMIKSMHDQATYKKKEDVIRFFDTNQVRGKWEILR